MVSWFVDFALPIIAAGMIGIGLAYSNEISNATLIIFIFISAFLSRIIYEVTAIRDLTQEELPKGRMK